MRVTDWMRSNDLLTNLRHRTESIANIQAQLASGKRINQPSDDPAGVGKALHYHHRLARNEQYERNIEDGLAYMSFLDGVLDNVGNILNQTLAAAVQGDNSSLTAEDRAVLANEVDQLLEELISKGNASYNGKFIFGGYSDQTLPFQVERDENDMIVSVTQNPQGIDGEIQRAIGSGIRETINIGGGDHFQPGGAGETDDMFQILINLRDGLINNDLDIVGEQIDRLQEAIDHNNLNRSTLGAKVNYFERRLDQISAAKVQLTDSLAQVEDADLIESALLFEQEQTALTAAMAVGARIIQISLLDFM